MVDGSGENNNCYVFVLQEMSNLSMTLIHPMKVETGDLMKWQNKVVQELAGEFNQKHIRDYPYVTSAKGLGGWVLKMAIFADVQYSIYAYILGLLNS